MDPKIFNHFRELIYETAGIRLSDEKVSLVEGRIGRRMRTLQLTEHADYLNLVRGDASGEELIHLIDAISTNVTSLFREEVHFDILAAELLKRYQAGQRKFRLWSAACSSGEEPASILITVAETLPIEMLDFRLLGTDISTRILDRCRAQIFRDEAIQKLSPQRRTRFSPTSETDVAGNRMWRLDPGLTKHLSAHRLNLVQPPFPMKGPFDAVFCRNVMIYFDKPTRERLVAGICKLLASGSLLFTGHAESLAGISNDLQTVRPSVYRKK